MSVPAWVRTIPRLPYPSRIYYLSLVDPTSCFSQRYFLKHCAKVYCCTPTPTRKEVCGFYFSNQLYTLNFRTKAPFVHWVHRQSISTIGSLVNIYLNSSGTLLSIPNAIGCLAHITTLCS